MSIAPRKKIVNIEARWCMKLETTRIVRGLIYTIAMGVVTSVVVVEGASELSVGIGIFYIIGALLVFGVDIQVIELGPLKIEFESSSGRDGNK